MLTTWFAICIPGFRVGEQRQGRMGIQGSQTDDQNQLQTR